MPICCSPVEDEHRQLLGFGVISVQMQDSVPLAFGTHLDL
jgi:hypothetical protein